MSNSYDVAIIGGGPAGLSAALVLARANRRVVLIDSERPRNGPARVLHNYLGHDGCSPQDLRNAGKRDLARYGIEIQFGQVTRADCLEPDGQTQFCVEMACGRSIMARKLLFATGVCDELPTWPGFAECYGNTVHHCPYCDAYEYLGRTVVAYGKQPSEAAGLGMALLTWTPRVVLVSEGTEWPDDRTLRRRLECLNLEWQHGHITRLQHRAGELTGIELDNGATVDCDAMFFNSEQSPQCELPRGLGCRNVMNDDHATNRKQQTSVPGVYLAGDADGDVKFAIVAAAEGAKAAVAINRELQEESLARLELEGCELARSLSRN